MQSLPYYVVFQKLADRTLVFGRAASRIARIEVTQPGATSTTAPGAGGAFLFVFDGSLQRGQCTLTARDGAGKVVR